MKVVILKGLQRKFGDGGRELTRMLIHKEGFEFKRDGRVGEFDVKETQHAKIAATELIL